VRRSRVEGGEAEGKREVEGKHEAEGKREAAHMSTAQDIFATRRVGFKAASSGVSGAQSWARSWCYKVGVQSGHKSGKLALHGRAWRYL
jgi:hypothetical protein